MDAQEAKTKFKSADALFAEGQFPDAFQLLAELDTAFPNTRDILLPMALCLERMGRFEDSDRLCDRLIQELNDPRAQEIKSRIQKATTSGVGASGIPGLDSNLLQDLFEPVSPQIAPPPPPASNMLRNTLVGAGVVIIVGLVTGLGVLGFKQGWFAWQRDTVQSVEAKLTEFWQETDARSAYVEMASNVPSGPMPMALSLAGSIDYLNKKEGQSYFRLEAVNSTNYMQMKIDMPILVVFDGQNLYFQMDMMGQIMAMKMKLPNTVAQSLQPGKSPFDELHEEFDAKLLPKESLDGQLMHVMQLAPKAGAAPPRPIPGMDFHHAKLYIPKNEISRLKAEMCNAEGSPILSLSLKDIRTNPELAPTYFNYTPPAGVSVMDMSDITKMMPMMPSR